MAKTIARISTRVFLGKELCRQDDWLTITTNMNFAAQPAITELRSWNPYVAVVAKYFLSSYRKMHNARLEALAFMKKVVDARLKQMADEGAAYERPKDTLQWSIDQGVPYHDIAEFQIGLVGVANSTTGATLTHMLFDLALYPEVADALRTEIEDVIGDGMVGVKSQLEQLKLLESFMKESQRMSPLGYGMSHPPIRHPRAVLTPAASDARQEGRRRRGVLGRVQDPQGRHVPGAVVRVPPRREAVPGSRGV